MDLRTKEGLRKAPQIMLSGILGPKKQIPAGRTVSGFLLFNTPATKASKIWLDVVLEREPELETAAYEKVKFHFEYIQDPILLKRQPATKRT